MARIAVVVRGDVIGSLAFGDDPVVAAEAGSMSGAVIHVDQRPEVIARMAQVAPVGAGDVVRWLRRRADAAAGCVAAFAGARRPFEDPVHVAVLARQVAMRALQLKPGSTVARYEWARLERTEGKVEEAVKDFEKVVHDDPDWAQPHVELAALYFRLNRQADGERERAVFDRLNAAHPKP